MIIAIIATVVGGLILAAILGDGDSATTTTVPAPRPSSENAEPENFSEAVEGRSFWTSPPFLTDEGAEEGHAETAPFDSYSVDLQVTEIRNLVEDPDSYEGEELLLVGRVVEQQDVSGPFIHHEFRAEGAKPYYDFYVAVGEYGIGPFTGSKIWMVGTLAGVGFTRDPSGQAHRTAYIDARDLESINEVFSADEIGSSAVREALEALPPR